jgi:prepilin-type N-terminal cleavage/methylation domain-containing protein
MTPSGSSSRHAFTLVELLIVIAIIAILITLLFPAADAAFEQARRTKAKNDAVQIANGLTAYYTEYGKFPETAMGGDANGADLMNTLAGAKEDDPDNPRAITFLEIPRAKQKKNGAESGGGGNYSSGYYDSWGELYEIKVDDDYDGKIDDAPGGDVRKSVIVWSQGNPKKPTNYGDPAKWIKSWE